MIQLYVISSIIMLILVLVIFLIKRKQIMSFLYPNNWVYIEMLELDNSISEWIEKKNPDLRFQFNEGYYNMYHQSVKENGDPKVNPAIYRDGRLAKFFFHEGFSDPLDFRQGKISGNPQISRQLETLEVSKLFEDNKNIAQEFFKKYGLVIMGIILIMVLYLIFKKPEQVVQTVQQIPR